jgi:hypothetical protein
MKIFAKLFCSVLLLFLMALAGCSKKPTVTDLWIDEAYDGYQYGKILVIGAAEKITFRNLFEGELVNRLRSQGIDAIPSYEILPYNNMLTRETVLAAVEKYAIDSVLITSLADRSKKTVYYTLDGGNPYAYYNDLYITMHSPGRIPKPATSGSYDIDILFLKTNLYDVQSEKLIWSMTSESEFLYKMESLDSAISLVIKKLREDGLI